MRIALGVAVLAVAVVAVALRSRGAADDPDVAFTIHSPSDGTTVTSPVILDVGLQGATLGLPQNGLDHLHLSLDGGLPIAEYSSSRLPLQIPPSHHTLTVEIAGPDHAPGLPSRSVTFAVAG